MSSSYKVQIAFGIFALCAFYLIQSEAQIKPPIKIPLRALSRRPISVPSTSGIRTATLSKSKSISLDSIDLKRRMSSSSSSISSQSSQSKSLSSFNTAQSPTNMHHKAASMLNLGSASNLQSQSGGGLLKRLFLRGTRTYGKYLKNTAIGIGGFGGAISVMQALSSDSKKEEKNNGDKFVTEVPIKSTTVSDITNPIGTLL